MAIKREWTTENMEFFNLRGIPQFPCHADSTRQALAIGLMIGGPPFSEGRVLALASSLRTSYAMAQAPPATQGLSAVPEEFV
jgi:Asp-tRNA(Asn)/Glu-tRNA(Gln) amidotransferase A subunit family amidase